MKEKIKEVFNKGTIITVIFIAISFFAGYFSNFNNNKVDTNSIKENLEVEVKGAYCLEIVCENTDKNITVELYDSEGNLIKNDNVLIKDYGLVREGIGEIYFNDLKKGVYTVVLNGDCGEHKISLIDQDEISALQQQEEVNNTEDLENGELENGEVMNQEVMNN